MPGRGSESCHPRHLSIDESTSSSYHIDEMRSDHRGYLDDDDDELMM